MLYEPTLLDKAMNTIKDEIIKDLSESASKVTKSNGNQTTFNEFYYDSSFSD